MWVRRRHVVFYYLLGWVKRIRSWAVLIRQFIPLILISVVKGIKVTDRNNWVRLANKEIYRESITAENGRAQMPKIERCCCLGDLLERKKFWKFSSFLIIRWVSKRAITYELLKIRCFYNPLKNSWSCLEIGIVSKPRRYRRCQQFFSEIALSIASPPFSFETLPFLKLCCAVLNPPNELGAANLDALDGIPVPPW
jgi:hypothetical protein